jgi:cell division protein FtsQ
VLDVDEITVRGTLRTTPAEVRRAAGIRPGAAMVDLDAGAAARRIEARPWVASATVQRHWPSSVEVRVVERRPVAQAPAGISGPWRVLDRTGRVLAETTHADPGLVQVAGVTPGAPGTSSGPHDGLVLAAALTARLAAAAATVEEGSAGLELALRGGIAVRFGSTERLEDKIVALEAILAQAPQTPPIATIDVRVPTSPVLTRKADDA